MAQKEALFRRGLGESLEEFAARVNSTPADARASWRLQGMRMLRSDLAHRPWTDWIEHVTAGVARVCPGCPVPTTNPLPGEDRP